MCLPPLQAGAYIPHSLLFKNKLLKLRVIALRDPHKINAPGIFADVDLFVVFTRKVF
jgi:hypothetical protein